MLFCIGEMQRQDGLEMRGLRSNIYLTEFAKTWPQKFSHIPLPSLVVEHFFFIALDISLAIF